MPAYILRNVACDITRARAHGVYKEKPVKRYIHTSCVLLRSVGHATHMRRKGERESEIRASNASTIGPRSPPGYVLDPGEQSDPNDIANQVAA